MDQSVEKFLVKRAPDIELYQKKCQAQLLAKELTQEDYERWISYPDELKKLLPAWDYKDNTDKYERGSEWNDAKIYTSLWPKLMALTPSAKARVVFLDEESHLKLNSLVLSESYVSKEGEEKLHQMVDQWIDGIKEKSKAADFQKTIEHQFILSRHPQSIPYGFAPIVFQDGCQINEDCWTDCIQKKRNQIQDLPLFNGFWIRNPFNTVHPDVWGSGPGRNVIGQVFSLEKKAKRARV